MACNLTDGKKTFVTIHDECPDDLAVFIMDSFLLYMNTPVEDDCCDVSCPICGEVSYDV